MPAVSRSKIRNRFNDPRYLRQRALRHSSRGPFISRQLAMQALNDDKIRTRRRRMNALIAILFCVYLAQEISLNKISSFFSSASQQIAVVLESENFKVIKQQTIKLFTANEVDPRHQQKRDLHRRLLAESVDLEAKPNEYSAPEETVSDEEDLMRKAVKEFVEDENSYSI